MNNVETLAQVTWIIAHGADEFRAAGTDVITGHDGVHLCGDVADHGVFELPLGTPFARLDRGARGRHGLSGRPVKMVCSGVANAVLRGDDWTRPPTSSRSPSRAPGSVRPASSSTTTRPCALAVGALVLAVPVRRVLRPVPAVQARSPPRSPTRLQRIEAEGDASQFARIEGALRTVTDGNRCYLAVEEQLVVSSILREFPEDVVAHEEGRCRLRHDLVLPKFVDFDGTRFRYDERQARKRPDWTYA